MPFNLRGMKIHISDFDGISKFGVRSPIQANLLNHSGSCETVTELHKMSPSQDMQGYTGYTLHLRLADIVAFKIYKTLRGELPLFSFYY